MCCSDDPESRWLDVRLPRTLPHCPRYGKGCVGGREMGRALLFLFGSHLAAQRPRRRCIRQSQDLSGRVIMRIGNAGVLAGPVAISTVCKYSVHAVAKAEGGGDPSVSTQHFATFVAIGKCRLPDLKTET